MLAEHNILIQRFCEAAASDLAEFAVLHDAEPSKDLLHNLKEVVFPDNLGIRLSTQEGKEALELMTKAVQQAEETETYLDELATDFAAIYLNNTFAASPYESTWTDEEGLLRQDAMFQVREWYKKYDLVATDWKNRSEDHLSLQLQFLSHLFRQATLNAQKDAAQFLDEHLLRWIEKFAKRVASRCGTSYYAGLVLLTAQYLENLRNLMAEMSIMPRPTEEEIEARMQPNNKPEEVPLQYMPGVAKSW